MTSQGERAGGPARGRLEYLAAGGQILESSLDYETTLTELGQLVVPALADWYSVDLVDEQGTVTNLTVAHVDPAKVELAHELRRRLPPRPGDRGASERSARRVARLPGDVHPARGAHGSGPGRPVSDRRGGAGREDRAPGRGPRRPVEATCGRSPAERVSAGRGRNAPRRAR